MTSATPTTGGSEPPPGPLRVAIVGASGYTGAELLRLLASHPDLQLEIATGDSMAGTRIADLYPSLALAYGDRAFEPYDPAAVAGVDLVFCGLPHGISMGVVPELAGKVGRIIDLGSDFRLRDASLYPTWYGADHTAPELLADAAYGLPELFRDQIAKADLIAATGCN
ncbi:MAG: N-acetyl-gamma-glutamyl-phosphate reductase, partial [Actinomycetota bacterium]